MKDIDKLSSGQDLKTWESENSRNRESDPVKPTVVMERQDCGKGPRAPDTEAADEQVRHTVGITSN